MEINVILIASFEKRLKTLGYAPSTVYGSASYVRDFFFYLKAAEVTSLEQIQPATVSAYLQHLQTRTNKRQNGGLSPNYITSNINAVRRFSRYLQETGKPFFEVAVKAKPDRGTAKTILTPAEVKALYSACGSDTLGIRDRAILGIYYGCGLRRSEGLSLNVSDILLKEKRIHVRKGKGNRERYVPMTAAVREDLESYLYGAREQLQRLQPAKSEALLLSMQTPRMCGSSLIERVHKLAEAASLQKPIGLHTLRHSIATHLLQSGLTLEEVSQFLGHSSLESTQIYTHIANAEL